MSQADTPGFVAVTTIAVPSRDQKRAVDFYIDTMGFEKRLDAEFQPGFRWIEVAPPGSPVSIALPTTPEGHPVGVDTGIRLSVPDAEAARTRLKDAGADVDELLLWESVPPMFSMRDPEGNTLYVVEVMKDA